MKYMGSKRRIWKHIAPIILENRKKGQYYVEPFCGGCNSISQVKGKRIVSDINPYLIAMWKGLMNNEKMVFDIDKEYYDQDLGYLKTRKVFQYRWFKYVRVNSAK